MYPVEEKEKTVVTLGYKALYPVTKWFKDRGLTFHDGIDISFLKEYADQKFHIVAPVDGQVIWADWQDPNNHDKGFGLHIILLFIEKATYSVELYYLAHLDSITVNEGLRVKKGTRIAVMGNSGASTARHLHIGRKVLKNYGRLVTANPKVVL